VTQDMADRVDALERTTFAPPTSDITAGVEDVDMAGRVDAVKETTSAPSTDQHVVAASVTTGSKRCGQKKPARSTPGRSTKRRRKIDHTPCSYCSHKLVQRFLLIDIQSLYFSRATVCCYFF